MNKLFKIIAVLFLITTIAGTLLKLNKYPVAGDVLLLISIVAFIYLAFKVIVKYIFKK